MNPEVDKGEVMLKFDKASLNHNLSTMASAGFA